MFSVEVVPIEKGVDMDELTEARAIIGLCLLQPLIVKLVEKGLLSHAEVAEIGETAEHGLAHMSPDNMSPGARDQAREHLQMLVKNFAALAKLKGLMQRG